MPVGFPGLQFKNEEHGYKYRASRHYYVLTLKKEIDSQ